ncbi:MAG: DUF3883 domain-containing protein [Phycisphaeraceae bacterium]
MLELVRRSLVEEAKRSPGLLSDLAGLEHYIAESYDARSFVELLQNADDAGATRFVVERVGDFVLVANDGRPFTPSDFESLCRSATSQKQRGQSIGFRGIGFKSVVGLARTIHLISGKLEATFSRERTAQEVPAATRVPLVRIPHPLLTADRQHIADALDRLAQDGMRTVFVFSDLLAGGVEKEFEAFDSTSLLFIRHVRQVELRTTTQAIVTVRREQLDANTLHIRLTDCDSVASWMVVQDDAVAVAYRMDGDNIAKLDDQQAVVHAFLPTNESTGINAKIHGDFSTDPSRTRVVLDERTSNNMRLVAKLVMPRVVKAIRETGKTSQQFLAAVAPTVDPRMAAFQRKCFKTEWFDVLRRIGTPELTSLRLRPAWLNAADFERLATVAGVIIPARHCESIEGLTSFLRFLGAKEASFDELSPALDTVTPTLTGAADVVAHLVTGYSTKQISTSRIQRSWNLWPIGDSPASCDEAVKSQKSLNRDFVDMVSEKAAMPGGLNRLIRELADQDAANLLSPDPAHSSAAQSKKATDRSDRQNGILGKAADALSLKKWRGAEQQVLEVLKAHGWNVEDVSRQNVGYDIEGTNPNGDTICVEVKSVDHPGQPFTLTSNEEAVARQKGMTYLLAVVRQANTQLEIAFIPDPANRLELTRQCRQWVWECSSYPFEPERYPLQ